MSKVSYAKGVRTRYRNVLAREMDKAQKLLQENVKPYETDDIISTGQLCLKLLNTYSAKLESASKELVSVTDESDPSYIQDIIDEDCQLILNVEETAYTFEQFIQSLTKKEENKAFHKGEEMNHVVQLQEKVQDFMLKQMKEQREFFHRYETKDKCASTTVKLPSLDICNFTGNKLKWAEFWDAFECTVHKNPKLSNIEKFNYLLSKLRDDAKLAIAGISLSNGNYEIAIHTLKERFGNKQERVDLHYKALLNIPPTSSKVQSLRQFLNATERHLRSLEVLEQNMNQQVFVSIIRSKLPEDVLRQLEFKKGSGEDWTIHSIRHAIHEYVNACEKAEFNNRSLNGKKQDLSTVKHGVQDNEWNSSNGATAQFPSSSSETLLANTNESTQPRRNYSKSCRYCEKPHWSDECLKYQTIEERKKQIKGSCYKCLREGHMAKECKGSKSCVYCGEFNMHHRSLCPKKYNKKKSSNETISISLSSDPDGLSTDVPTSKENVLVSSGEMVLMQTAKTEVKNKDKSKGVEVRALLDCGSQRTYITQRLAEKLGLKSETEENILISTFGNKNAKAIKISSTTMMLKLKNGHHMKISASIVPVISGNIHRKQLDIKAVKNLDHLLCSVDLADTIPIVNETTSVDLLIGNDFYLDIILSQRIEVQPGLYLLSSKLGWILTGRTEGFDNSSHEQTSMLIMTHGNIISNTSVFQNVDSSVPRKPDLEDFWNVESIGVLDNTDTSEDEQTMNVFKDTVQFKDGRYEVTWPWKTEEVDLPLNKELSYGRLKSCVKKLMNKPEVLKKYDSIIQDQLDKGIIERVNNTMKDGMVHYLPHHAVITPLKSTTKVRIVYDASAKTRPENKSLNECLNRGPVMLHDLCGLLLRFRLHRIAMIADIEKAFLQIGLRPDQRNVTRFMWLKSCENLSLDSNNIQEFRFCRVPFGIISSPFLLGATVENHLEKYGTICANKVKEDIYVDNLITGTDNVEEALTLYKNSKNMFKEASMNLREWFTNSDEVSDTIPEEDRSKTTMSTVLGHIWDHKSDDISIKKPKFEISNVLTKRIILKKLSSVFDPLGLVNPILLRGKLLLQTMWTRKLEWDDPINDTEITKTWIEIETELEQISDCRIPRCISLKDGRKVQYDLLCFCDASSVSYATVLYLRQSTEDSVKVNMVFAKSRLAPVKGMTIPRLELMAVLIGTRCLKFVRDQMHLTFQNVYLWTDSRCVLGWLKSERSLPVFVRNRVKEINKENDVRVNFIRTHENPADIATRGTSVKELSENSNWWCGPKWLTESTDKWPEMSTTEIVIDSEDVTVSACEPCIVVHELATPFDIDTFDFDLLGNAETDLDYFCTDSESEPILTDKTVEPSTDVDYDDRANLDDISCDGNVTRDSQEIDVISVSSGDDEISVSNSDCSESESLSGQIDWCDQNLVRKTQVFTVSLIRNIVERDGETVYTFSTIEQEFEEFL